MTPSDHLVTQAPDGWPALPWPGLIHGSSTPAGTWVIRRSAIGRPDAGRNAANSAEPCLQPRHSLIDGRLCGMEATASHCAPPGLADGAARAEWLLHAACAQASVFGHAMLVSVRLPSETPCDRRLVTLAETALRRSAVRPDLLEIGFSEPAFSDVGTDALLCVSALRDLGVSVAIRVSGSAPVHPRIFCRAPMTCLHLPAVLVSELSRNRTVRSSASELIGVAHAFGMTAVALGVQSALERDILADLGCDAAQGPLCGLPMPAHAIHAALDLSNAF